jgi:hypothetical protein
MFKIKILVILAVVALVPVIFMPRVAAVGVLNTSCNPQDASSSVCKDNNSATNAPNPIFGANGIMTRAIEILSYIVGIVSVVMIIVSALRMVISGGDPNTVGSARSAIIYSVAGVVIAVIAQGIVVFVLKRV